MQNQINSNNISSSAVTPQMNYTDIVSQLEQAIATDTLRLQTMLQQGVITKQQGLEAEDWVNHLAETYNVSRPILLHNYTKVVVMNEDQVEESIELMQDLLKYYKAVIEG